MEPEQPTVREQAWPPPHPSPPLPPPREYGSPGTPRNRHPWLWAVLAAVVVGVVVSGALVYAVRGLGDGDPGTSRPEPGQTGVPTDSPATETSPGPEAAYRCWDGSPASQLADCSRPEGEAGLRWVFPATAHERCAPPTEAGDGAVLRMVCRHVTGAGARIQVGYFQWRSVGAAIRFYDGQGLDRSEQTGPGGEVTGYQWSGTRGGVLKVVTLYGQEPYSSTGTMPTDTVLTADDLADFAARPAEEIRGEPVG